MDINHYTNNYSKYLQDFDEKLQLLQRRLGNVYDANILYGMMHHHFRQARSLFQDIYRRYLPQDYAQLRAALQKEQDVINLTASFSNQGNRRGGQYRYMEVTDVLHEHFNLNADQSDNNDDDHNLCVACGVPNDNSHYCVCEYVDSNDIVAMRTDSEFADTLDAMYNNLESGAHFALDPESEQARQIVISSTCKNCGQKAHFTRDCPQLGGTGNSKLGDKFGTAKGFREGDDPQDRPKAYRDARAKQVRRAQAIAKRTSRSTLQSKKKGGKFATHARRMRTGLATAPRKPDYQALLHALLLYGIAETITHREQTDPGLNMIDATLNSLPAPANDSSSDSD